MGNLFSTSTNIANNPVNITTNVANKGIDKTLKGIDAAGNIINTSTGIKIINAQLLTKLNNVIDYNINIIENGIVNINGNEFKINSYKSKIEETDTLYEYIINPLSLPVSLDLRQFILPVRNQGKIGSCVSFSSSTMIEFQIKTSDYLSPAFIYRNRENQTTSGMEPKNALNILQNKGVCLDSILPYTTISDTSNIPQDALSNALNYKILNYAFIQSIEELQNALLIYGPCIIAVPVYNTNSLEIWKKGSNDTLLGGHCMCVVGYLENNPLKLESPGGAFIIRNSWGASWGDNGYTYFSYSDWGIQWEVWSCYNSNYSKPISNVYSKSPEIINKPNNILNKNKTFIIIFGVIFGIIIIIIIYIIYMTIYKKKINKDID